MKTNQNMVRRMGNYDIIQRTQDGYFDANLLLHQWNKNPEHTRRRIDDFLSSVSTKEFMEALIKEESSEKGNFAIPNNQAVIKGKTKTLSDGTKIPASVWMHPFLFIDFAMWINPTFKVKVIKFVYDEMIKYRHEAGDEYRALSAAIRRIVPADFMQTAMKKIAEALNWIVFNSHETGIRNKFGDEQKQRELSALERKVADLINEDFITDYNQLISYLKRLYRDRCYPKVFA
jgi:23S rRNA-/tRNA-specific pseudouridylate synthase